MPTRMRFLKVALGLSLGLGAWLPVLAAEEAALQTPETTTELWRYRAGDAEYRISRVERRRLGGELESAELSVVRVGPDGVDRRGGVGCAVAARIGAADDHRDRDQMAPPAHRMIVTAGAGGRRASRAPPRLRLRPLAASGSPA